MGLVELDKLRDSLSGFYNREALSEHLYNQAIAARSHNKVFSLIILDIDHFKLINDRYGHLSGDEGIKFFAGALNSCLSGEYFVARFGGDEFIIILNDKDTKESLKLAKSIRNQLNKKPFTCMGKSIFITASIGIAVFPSDAQNGPDLLKKADAALYRAKKKGRNQIVIVKNFQIIRDQIKLAKILKVFLFILIIGLSFIPVLHFTKTISLQSLYNKLVIESNYFYHKLKYDFNYCVIELKDGYRLQGWIVREDSSTIYLLEKRTSPKVTKISREKVRIYIRTKK